MHRSRSAFARSTAPRRARPRSWPDHRPSVQGHVPGRVDLRPPFGVSAAAYESLDDFVAHAIEIERGLIADAIAAGCRYVQLDFPLYPYLVDPRWAARFEAAGHRIATSSTAIAADRAILEGIPEGVTTGLHVCRGNYRSSWLCSGSLDPLAERMFSELPYDVFLVEWDDVGRDGGYAPIRFVPAGRIVVMGLVSSKCRELEPEDDLLRRLDEAAELPPARAARALDAVRLRLRHRGQRDRRGHAMAKARPGRARGRSRLGTMTPGLEPPASPRTRRPGRRFRPHAVLGLLRFRPANGSAAGAS